jgi:cytoskeletal protein RodZ
VRIDIESNIANLFDSSTYLYLKNNIPKKPIPTLKDIAIFLIPWIVVYIITAIIVYLGWYRDKKSLVKKRPSETNIEAQQDLESSLYDDFNPEIIDEVEEIPVEDEDDTMPETQESENKKNDV